MSRKCFGHRSRRTTLQPACPHISR
jgi:hypothetical protein